MYRILSSILFCIITICGFAAEKTVTITLQNTLSTTRIPEMVEISFSDIQKRLGIRDSEIVVFNNQGEEILSQITYDGCLIFQCPQMAPSQKVVYYVKKRQKVEEDVSEMPMSLTYSKRVFGRQYPERQQDFSFENDRIGYRLYGPQTQKKKEHLYGYDIFNKRTEALILDQLYADQTDAQMWGMFSKLNKRGSKHLATALYMDYCYHIDHGMGMDCYKVGPTLGAGTNAILSADGSTIIYPWCYESYKVLDNGPLRLTVSLDYGNRIYNGNPVHESRVLTIDAGSNMVKAHVTYENLPVTALVCAGIVIHTENPKAYLLNEAEGFMAYEDLGDVNVAWEGFREQQAKAMGRIFIGTLFPSPLTNCKFVKAEGISGATGHILSIQPYATNGFTYYFGSGWDRNPTTSFTSLDDWTEYLRSFSHSKRTPIKVKLR